jgi:DNA-directed RNA polymerase subunit L
MTKTDGLTTDQLNWSGPDGNAVKNPLPPTRFFHPGDEPHASETLAFGADVDESSGKNRAPPQQAAWMYFQEHVQDKKYVFIIEARRFSPEKAWTLTIDLLRKRLKQFIRSMDNVAEMLKAKDAEIELPSETSALGEILLYFMNNVPGIAFTYKQQQPTSDGIIIYIHSTAAMSCHEALKEAVVAAEAELDAVVEAAAKQFSEAKAGIGETKHS